MNLRGYSVFVVVLCLSLANSLNVNFDWTNVKDYSSYSVGNTTSTFYSPEDLILSEDKTSFYLLDSYNKRVVLFNVTSGETRVRDTSDLVRNSSYNVPFSLVQVPVRYSQGNWSYDPLATSTLFGFADYFLLCQGFFSNESTCTQFPGLQDFRSGLTYSPNNTLLYASFLFTQRVMAFNLSDSGFFLSSPILVYGVNITTDPSPVSLNGPLKTVVDCQGGLWLADWSNNRVLHFPANSTTADIVLGQINFVTNSWGISDHEFSNSTSIAMDNACSVLFVGDGSRVLRFRSPFRVNSTAEAVLGANSFSDNNDTNSGFDTIFSLHFEDYNNGSGRLYILNRGNNRMVSGVTFIGSSTEKYPLSCGSSSAQACQVSGDVYVINEQILTFSSNQLQVGGNLKLSGETQVQVTAQQVITAAGKVTFDGTLIVDVTSSAIINGSGNVSVELFRYNSSSGQFVDVQVTGESVTCTTGITPSYGLSSLVVLISQQCRNGGDGGDGEERRKVIIGVVVGVGGCILIVIIAGVLLGFFALWYRHRHRKGAARV